MPGSSGTPAAIAASRAVCLLPNTSRCSGDGPAKTSPASSQARANAASSERNPYPGWTASRLVSSAAAMIASERR